MSDALLSHTDKQIQEVAAGLLTLLDRDDAEQQLARLYGPDRSEAALVMLHRQARSARRSPEVLVGPTVRPAVSDQVAVARPGRTSSARGRLARSGRWLVPMANETSDRAVHIDLTPAGAAEDRVLDLTDSVALDPRATSR